MNSGSDSASFTFTPGAVPNRNMLNKNSYSNDGYKYNDNDHEHD